MNKMIRKVEIAALLALGARLAVAQPIVSPTSAVPRLVRERGFYLHPELYGAPGEKGIFLWAGSSRAMKQWKEAQAKAAAANAKEAPPKP